MMPSPDASRTNAQRARAVRQALATARRAEYARLRDGGLSQEKAGELMGISPRSIGRYETDYQAGKEGAK